MKNQARLTHCNNCLQFLCPVFYAETSVKELMISVTKEQSSFAHFFKTRGGITRELSVEFDLMRDKSGRTSELEADLNAEGFK